MKALPACRYRRAADLNLKGGGGGGRGEVSVVCDVCWEVGAAGMGLGGLGMGRQGLGEEGGVALGPATACTRACYSLHLGPLQVLAVVKKSSKFISLYD